MILNMLRGILAATAITLASAAPVPTPVPDARVLPATAQPASITLGTVSSSNITATIVPSAADVGSTQTVWMGAIFQGTLYLRNGTAWQPYTGGNYPVAIQSQPLAASTTINVVNNLDISGLIGLQLYVGFGTSQMDMFTAPGKLALIYTVPAPQLTAISLATSLAAGSSAHISPVPSAATLGSCSSNNTSVATVSGNTVTAVNPGTVTITCSGQSAILVVTSAPLTGISLAPSSLAVGSQSQVSAQPSNASLGSCTSSNPSVASVTGSLVTANNAGTATITCSGKSAVITVTAPSCAQTAAGTYSGSISGSYSGSA
ncbi:MAG: hypothetical protein JO218_05015, partial [Burkholderiales bacterium]|nr:hypothetical protein [Burkholderiales bacterium]